MTLQIPSHVFREYDVRGIAGKDLTPEFARLLGRGYSKMLFDQNGSSRALRVSVGKDCRLSSDAYAEALIQGMIEQAPEGRLQVVRLGVCPTPLTYFSVFHLELDGGIMVTGSHNPADYNGFKIGIGKGTLHGERIQELKSVMQALLKQRPDSLFQSSMIEDFEIIPAYIDFVVKASQNRGLIRKKIVLDAGNGTAATVAPKLFEKLGAQVIPLYCELDGRFPNHHPDPTVPENLKALTETVKREKADFGVAFDGDSDRIGVVDETGRILFGDELMILFSRDVLQALPGSTIISEVKSSYRLYDDIAKRGGVPLMWKTGHSLIKSKMKETHAALAGEMSGHIFFADRYFGYDDAIYAAVRAYEIASRAQGPFSALLADVQKTAATPEIRVDCEEELKFQLVSKVKEQLKKDPAFARAKLNDIDGVRIDLGDGWGLLRASNTQPVIVLRFEAQTPARLREIQGSVETLLVNAASALGHPPLQLSGGHG